MENGGQLLERKRVVIYALLKILLSLNKTDQGKREENGY